MSLSAAHLFREALATYEAAILQGRVEAAASEARVARLRLAAELERQGRYDEARVVIDAVRAEQEAAGASPGDDR